MSELIEDGGSGGLDVPAIEVPDGADVIESPFGGYIWKLLVAEGDEVEAGATVAVIEAMKMETPLESPAAGTISALYIEERQPIEPGAPLMALSRRP